MNLLKQKYKWFIIALIIIAIDLITKHIANTELSFADSVEITPFFSFTLLYNHGAAFSFLSDDQTSWQLIMFSIISLTASIVLTVMIIKEKTSTLKLTAYAFILGGALGNFYDRAFQGFVIDFLDFHIGEHHWPAFNVADSAITVGVALIIIQSLFFSKNK